MRFRLTYDGPLYATQGEPKTYQTDKRAEHKHAIRRVFHFQLQHLWATDRFLSSHHLPGGAERKSRPVGDEASYWGGDDQTVPMALAVADWHQEFGYRFVPLVREEWSLLCGVSVLLLRRDGPGNVIQSAGDIDNRLKTLLDALRKPQNANELRGNENPGADENPFYCLLEDDKLISQLEVETDKLLDPFSSSESDQARVRAVITVNIRPHYATLFNLSFAT